MNTGSIIKSTEIVRVENGQTIQREDAIIDEEILTITINKQKAFEMVFSNTHAMALSIGFLYTQNIINSKKDILDTHFIENTNECCLTLTPEALERLNRFKHKGMIKGSSGGSLLTEPSDTQTQQSAASKNSLPHLTLTSNQVLSLIHQHWEHSRIFHKTGAVHSAGLCSAETVLDYFEDIGRHNAVDKLAGTLLLNQTRTEDKIMTLSCRMSLEIIGKIIRTRVPIVISNAAPTLSAVKMGKEAGLTIIGFAQNGHFNIYTHAKRILTD